MKSIGNGWKRAQAAQKLARQKELAEKINAKYLENYSRHYGQSIAPLATSNPLAELLGGGMRAMSPEAMKAKAEREAALVQNVVTIGAGGGGGRGGSRSFWSVGGVGGGGALDKHDNSVKIVMPKTAIQFELTLWQRIKRALR